MIFSVDAIWNARPRDISIPEGSNPIRCHANTPLLRFLSPSLPPFLSSHLEYSIRTSGKSKRYVPPQRIAFLTLSSYRPLHSCSRRSLQHTSASRHSALRPSPWNVSISELCQANWSLAAYDRLIQVRSSVTNLRIGWKKGGTCRLMPEARVRAVEWTLDILDRWMRYARTRGISRHRDGSRASPLTFSLRTFIKSTSFPRCLTVTLPYFIDAFTM